MDARKTIKPLTSGYSAFTEPLDERQLLSQVSAGDEKAFRLLFDRYWDNIYGIAIAFTKSSFLAEEMVQEIFLKLWLRRGQLAIVEKFNAYLFILARNHIFNVLRKKIYEEPFTDSLVNYFSDTGPCPDDLLLFKESQELVKKAVHELPHQQRLIFTLTRDKGMSQESIAGMLHISKHTVKSNMHKALIFIRKYLERSALIIALLYTGRI